MRGLYSQARDNDFFGGCKLEDRHHFPDDPLPLFRAIAQAANALSVQSADDAIVLNIPKREDVIAAPNLGPFKRRKLIWMTNHTRARLRDRELIANDVAQVVGAVREIFVEIGRRFYALGLLESPRDIFYLTVEEVLGYIEATIADADISGIVNARRTHYHNLSQRPATLSSFTAHIPVTVGNQVDQKLDATMQERRGLGVSLGFVRGRVWLAGSNNHPSIDGPFVLVAEYADSSWPLLYPGVNGIIVEQGGPLSSGVLVYRDQRIPAIVGVPSLTSWLSNGDLVDMDGSTGIIRKVADNTSTDTNPGAESVIKSPAQPAVESVEPDQPVGSVRQVMLDTVTDTQSQDLPAPELPSNEPSNGEPLIDRAPSSVNNAGGQSHQAPADGTSDAEDTVKDTLVHTHAGSPNGAEPAHIDRAEADPGIITTT